MKISVGIVGYGNIGKAVERICSNDEDFEIAGIFSRRDKSSLSSPYGNEFVPQNALLNDSFAWKIDVAMLCVGSAFDLEDTAVKIAARFCTVDCFDTHARMGEYLSTLDTVNRMCGTLSFVGMGWDPGIFSLERALLSSVMPKAIPQTFWGKGVSQGHSEAIRKIDGVKYATQYTLPKETAVNVAKQGETDLSAREKHVRVCYVVPDSAKFFGRAKVTEEEKAYLQKEIDKAIKTMPNYFADYDTAVYFVSEEEYFANHTKMYHAGRVIAVENERVCRCGKVFCTGEKYNEKEPCKSGTIKNYAEFKLSLDNNPDFTAQVMTAYAKANYRMWKEGETGAKTILDVPVAYLIDGDKLKFV
ncbi:MAG: diaminopimelate dehydrogenase [Clostridia bacterium]|nr:diaminopimelate dehydrogenase [Clostridia bacterium]